MNFTGVFDEDAQRATSSSAEQINTEEVLQNLKSINLSFNTVIIILIAIILNLYYIYRTRVDLLDVINRTKCGANLPNVSKLPEFANTLFLYSTAVFLMINYNDYIKKTMISPNKRDEVAIEKSYNTFFSSILAYIATVISRRNFDIDNI